MRFKAVYRSGRLGIEPAAPDGGTGVYVAIIGAAVVVAATAAYTIGRLERYYHEAAKNPLPAEKGAPAKVNEAKEEEEEEEEEEVEVPLAESLFAEATAALEEKPVDNLFVDAPIETPIEETEPVEESKPEPEPVKKDFFAEETGEEPAEGGDVPEDWYLGRG